MKRIICYTQQIPTYDPQTREQNGTETVHLSVESTNDHDFAEQLETVRGYCDDFRVEELPDEENEAELTDHPVLAARLEETKAVVQSVLEGYEAGGRGGA